MSFYTLPDPEFLTRATMAPDQLARPRFTYEEKKRLIKMIEMKIREKGIRKETFKFRERKAGQTEQHNTSPKRNEDDIQINK